MEDLKKVAVIEAQEQVGGLASTQEFASGFKCNVFNDVVKWIDPLVIDKLDLKNHGLELIQPDVVRIALDENLHSGKYVQCYACRRPLKISETKLKSYIKGTSCKYCIKTRSLSQKKRSATRQFQIDKAEKKGSPHPFKKISLNYI